MKGLIWFGCIFVLSLITTMLKNAGIILGAIPTVLLYSGAVWVARALTKSIGRDDSEDVVFYAPVQDWADVAGKVPGIVQDRCKQFSSDPEGLERYLNNCAKEKLIQQKYIPSIMKAYLSEAQFAQWDQAVKNKNASAPAYDQIRSRIPQAVKDYCRDHAQDPEKMHQYLNRCAADRIISREHIPAIMQEFTARPPQKAAPAAAPKPVQEVSLQEVLDHCTAIAHDPKQLESYLIQCINGGIVDCETASQIWNAYWKSQPTGTPIPELSLAKPEPVKAAPVSQPKPAPVQSKPAAPQTKPATAAQKKEAAARRTRKKRSPFLIFLLVVLVIAAGIVGIIQAPYLQGYRAYQKGDYRTVLQKLENRSGERAEQMYRDAALQLGQTALEGKEYKQAADYFAICEPDAHAQWLEAISLHAVQLAEKGQLKEADEILTSLELEDQKTVHADNIRLTLAEQTIGDAQHGTPMTVWDQAKAYTAQVVHRSDNQRLQTFYNRYNFALGSQYLSQGNAVQSRQAFQDCTDSEIADVYVKVLQNFKVQDYPAGIQQLEELSRRNISYQYAYGKEIQFSCPWETWEKILRQDMAHPPASVSGRLNQEKAALYFSSKQWQGKTASNSLSGIRLSDVTVQRNESSLAPLDDKTYNIQVTQTLTDIYKQCGTAPEGKILILRKAKERYTETLTVALEMMQKLPYQYFPEDLSQVEYVILLEYTYRETGYYRDYWGVGRIPAVQETGSVKVLAMPSKQQIHSPGSVTGNPPPDSISVSMSNSPKYASGGAPKLDDKLSSSLKAIETKLAAKK